MAYSRDFKEQNYIFRETGKVGKTTPNLIFYQHLLSIRFAMKCEKICFMIVCNSTVRFYFGKRLSGPISLKKKQQDLIPNLYDRMEKGYRNVKFRRANVFKINGS